MCMRFLKSPKLLFTLGSLVLAVLMVLAGREVIMRRQAREIPPYAVNVPAEQRTALLAKIAKAESDIRRTPNTFSPYVELALAKTDLGDRDGAAEVYRTMNQRFPGNYLSYQNLGKLYEDAGKYDMAAEQYLIAIQNGPRIVSLYRNIVNLYTYHLKSRASDIPRILQNGLAISPESADLTAMMAVYYRDFGQPAEAIKWYELLLVFDQGNKTALEELRALKEQVRRK